MALNDVNEDQGSDDSDSDEEIVADQSFPGKTIKTGYTNILAQPSLAYPTNQLGQPV